MFCSHRKDQFKKSSHASSLQKGNQGQKSVKPTRITSVADDELKEAGVCKLSQKNNYVRVREDVTHDSNSGDSELSADVQLNRHSGKEPNSVIVRRVKGRGGNCGCAPSLVSTDVVLCGTRSDHSHE